MTEPVSFYRPDGSMDEEALAIHMEPYYKECRAHMSVHLAVKSGALVKDPCVVCGEPKTHGHHEDYDARLDVVWLCSLHHAGLHAAKRRGMDLDGYLAAQAAMRA